MLAPRRFVTAIIIAGSAAHGIGNVLAVLTAGTLFTRLRDQLGHDAGGDLAGRVFGGILGDWLLISWPIVGIVFASAFIMAWIAWRENYRLGPIATIFLCLTVVTTHAWGHWLVSHVGELRTLIDATADPTEQASLQQRFDVGHQASTRVFAVETLALILLTTGQIIAAARRGGPCEH